VLEVGSPPSLESQQNANVFRRCYVLWRGLEEDFQTTWFSYQLSQEDHGRFNTATERKRELKNEIEVSVMGFSNVTISRRLMKYRI